MIAMQYKVILPKEYDMNIIKERVRVNGNKTDGFTDLLFKAYLVLKENESKGFTNEYSPLYLWKDSIGMNKFIFEGFYDNILNSFGWQNINIGIPFEVDLKEDFTESKYVVEIENLIVESNTMNKPTFSQNPRECTGKVIVYNPDKWRFVELYFYKNYPKDKCNEKIYEILHLSI